MVGHQRADLLPLFRFDHVAKEAPGQNRSDLVVGLGAFSHIVEQSTGKEDIPIQILSALDMIGQVLGQVSDPSPVEEDVSSFPSGMGFSAGHGLAGDLHQYVALHTARVPPGSVLVQRDAPLAGACGPLYNVSGSFPRKEAAMTHVLRFSDEELEVLAEIVNGEMSSSRQEYRHTDDREYRTRVSLRIDACRRILDRLQSAIDQTGQYESEITGL